MSLIQTITTATFLAISIGTVSAASNDALLDLLVEKGILTEAEAASVNEELEAQESGLVRAKGKAVQEIKLTGRLHLQYDNITNDGDSSSQNGFYFRRLYFGMITSFSEEWSGTLIANFGGNDGKAHLDRAVIGYDYADEARFEAGYAKVPFGFYETLSSSKIKTVERSIANRYFAEEDGLRFNARHSGLFAEGDLGSGFSYSAALVSATPGNERMDKLRDEDNGLAAFGRLQWTGDLGGDAKVTVGIDGGVKQDGARHVDDGKFATKGDLVAYGAHAEFENGDFTLSAEILGARVPEVASFGDADVFGYTVVSSYHLTKRWELVGAFSSIGSDGADLLDADDLVRRSNAGHGFDEGESVYAGFNYYVIGNELKLTGGYEKAWFESADGADEVEIDAVRFRLQALF